MANPEGCNQYKSCAGGGTASQIFGHKKIPAQARSAAKSLNVVRKAIRMQSTPSAEYAKLARRAGIGVREARDMGFTHADLRGHLEDVRGGPPMVRGVPFNKGR